MSGVCSPTPRFLTSSALQSYSSFDAFLIWMSASIFSCRKLFFFPTLPPLSAQMLPIRQTPAPHLA